MRVDNGRVYKGDSTSYSDQLFRIENGRIYKGDSTSYSDQLMRIEGPVTLPELVAILYAYKYL